MTLALSETPSRDALSAWSEFRSLEGLTARFEVDRSRVRDFSRRVLEELPVVDLTIADAPIEEGIERLYRQGAVRDRGL